MKLAERAVLLAGGAAPEVAPGKRVVAVFLASSLRTRTSLDAACHKLGAHLIQLSPGSDAWGWELAPGAVMDGTLAEHIEDAVPVLGQYGDLLAVRAFAGLTDRAADTADPVLAAFQQFSPVPVLSLESTRFHPLQGLADTTTWMTHLGPKLSGRRICLTWAPHPKALPQAVPHQVLLSAALQGMDVTVAHPEGFDLAPEVLEQAERLASAGGGGIRVVHDQAEGVRDAEVVYAKAWSGWSGYGRREEEAQQRATLSHWQVTEDLMSHAPKAGFMHCLPIRRNVVASDGVLRSPAAWHHEQAGWRLWTAAAVVEAMLEEGGAPWSA